MSKLGDALSALVADCPIVFMRMPVCDARRSLQARKGAWPNCSFEIVASDKKHGGKATMPTFHSRFHSRRPDPTP